MLSSAPSTKSDLSRFLQKQPNALLAKYLPFSIYRQYLSLAGLYYYGTNGDERRNISKSLRHVAGSKMGFFTFYHLLFKTYIGIFDHYYEKMVNAHKPLSGMMEYLKNHVSISGERFIDRTDDQGRILVTGHFGAVEYIPLYLAANNYRPSVILRFKTERLKETLMRKSSSVGLELIDARSPNVAFRALKALKEGRILMTGCDEIRDWRFSKKERINIFGYSIPKDRTLDIIYQRAKVPLLFGVIRRMKSGYDLSIQPLADGKEKISPCEAAWNLLERYIRKYPEQWYQWPNFYTDFNKYSTNVACYES
jgi:KDO2-lipid IV(A) lauroyltransferase